MIELREYQKKMVQEIKRRKNVLVVAPMGAGKTLSTLVALREMIVESGREVDNVLILAPKRVAQNVWVQEALGYNLGLNIRYCDRALDVKLFLLTPANHHVCVCSVTRIDEIPHGCWTTVVLDESTLFKHHRSKRSKEVRRICNRVPCRIALTGTPVHNGVEGLWHQCFILDGGKALGRTLGEFRRRYMRIKYQVNGVVSVFEADPAMFPQLLRDSRGVVYRVDADVKLPDCFFKTIEIDFGKRLLSEYRTFEETNVMLYKEETGKDAFAEDKAIVAFSRTSLGMKLRQFASGTVYVDETHSSYVVKHRLKIDMLKDIVESRERGILVAYQFKCEEKELRAAFPTARRIDTQRDVDDWNAGRIDVALVHPASVGHGLNLQFGGNTLVWFSLTYDGELYSQLNKRLHRTGQKDPVSVVHLIAKGTIEERILKILQRKEQTANSFAYDGGDNRGTKSADQ